MWVFGIGKVATVEIAPIQIHSLAFAVFSSVIAPFGGFFASGVKRAFKIKDFADSIPGHGGVTDRMDCQVLMGLFAYMYVSSFIKVRVWMAVVLGICACMLLLLLQIRRTSVSHVLNLAVLRLQADEQIELYHALRDYLTNQHLLAD